MFFACLNLLDVGPVPVDGSWGSWKDWSKCSQSCGGGTMYRVRNCDSPHTARGGEYCKGKPIEVKPCENQCKLNWYFNPSFYNFFLVFSCRSHWWFLGILGKMCTVSSMFLYQGLSLLKEFWASSHRNQSCRERWCQQSLLRGNETRPDLQTEGETCTVPPKPATGCYDFFIKCFLFQYNNICVTFALFNTWKATDDKWHDINMTCYIVITRRNRLPDNVFDHNFTSLS